MKLTIAAALLPLCASAAYNCQTELRTISAKSVPTYYVTSTDSIRPTKTVTSTPIQVQLDRSTNTVTRLSTTVKTVTNARVTDTFYTTTTVYDTMTNMITATMTDTSTSTSTTSSTSTTIVPTAPGWKPIWDTVNRNSLARRAALDDRKLEHPHAVRALQTTQAGLLAQSWPYRVHCTTLLANKLTKTVTEIAATVTTIKPTWFTATTTSTIISTSTKVPLKGIKGTITSSWTSTLTTSATTSTTITETTSTTTTSIIPGPTIYNACEGPRNIFGPNFTANNKPHFVANIANNGPGVASDFKIVADGASSPKECCAHCQAATGCETWAFRATSRNCFLMYHEGSSCTAQSQHPNFFLSTGNKVDAGAGYAVGNGNCGFTYSANSDSSVWRVDNF